MKTHKIIFFLVILLITTCKKDKSKYLVELYTDSLFTQKKESLSIDSLEQIKQNGFVKISQYDNKSSEKGRIINGKKVGKWKKYFNPLDQNKISEECTYSEKGDLINYKIYDLKTQKIIENRNYSNDNLVGIQQDFYPTGKLHIQFETDKNGRFINNYKVLSQNGKEIYQSFLGATGTGYIKYYDKDNLLIWEGLFKNKKKEGWHYEYLIEYGGKTTEKLCNQYKSDSLIQTKTQKF
ncbi:hypothetical protein [Flavobacterium oreochromis]|uniref:hypothetical protein n=1 Tax=Flavobacterium oreochromis TaxID=2906078 RepID=UPI001CE51C79|nr:hypothetical protein [Flavobacterium oreochromis]QYS87177.1 hypothetical protein JJC03_04310 [Flavobacterium oreochromis]